MATVLLVDDDTIIIQTLDRVLNRLGHEVLHARNGLEALAHLDTRHVDIVLCDIRMPVLDGASLAQYINAMTTRPYLIMMGRDLRAPGLAPALQQADAVLPKPITPDALEQALASLLGAG